MRKPFAKTMILVVLITLAAGCGAVAPTAKRVPPTVVPPAVPSTSAPTPATADSQLINPETAHTIRGHDDMIIDVAFTAEGEFLVSSGRDRNIKLWDVKSGQEVHSFRMSSVDMGDIDISVNRNLLASAEAIWDLESRQEIHVLERGLIVPGHVAFSPDGSALALGLFDQQITLWDVISGQPLLAFERQEENRTKSMDFSTDGSLVAAGVIDGTVRLFDVESGKIVKILKYGGETDIHHVVFSPDGRYLATGGRVPAVILWDVARGEVVKTFRLTPYFCAKVGGSYSVMQTGGISNRRIRWFSRKMANIWYHQKTAFDLAKTKELSDDRRIWPDR